MPNIVLYNPQIPQNTGNIARTCAVTGTALHLIKPYGFFISNKLLKRAGLDYWQDVDVYEFDSFEDFLIKKKEGTVFLLTSKAEKHYTEAIFAENDYIVFGSETAGLPQSIHNMYPDNRLRIPMRASEHARCLNLSNAAAIVLYEMHRQSAFKGLK
jgi:tRNA (cytidine/uridine-2'-O-)-methyltransferase